jgi:hypothetical protein
MVFMEMHWSLSYFRRYPCIVVPCTHVRAPNIIAPPTAFNRATPFPHSFISFPTKIQLTMTVKHSSSEEPTLSRK